MYDPPQDEDTPQVVHDQPVAPPPEEDTGGTNEEQDAVELPERGAGGEELLRQRGHELDALLGVPLDRACG